MTICAASLALSSPIPVLSVICLINSSTARSSLAHRRPDGRFAIEKANRSHVSQDTVNTDRGAGRRRALPNTPGVKQAALDDGYCTERSV